MSDYTADEIQEAINLKFEANELDGDDDYFEGWTEIGSTYSRVHQFLTLRGEEVPVSHVDNSWDNDGDAWVIFQVGDQLFRKEGWYQSYNGYEWDGDLFECVPRKRTVTDYIKKGMNND